MNPSLTARLNYPVYPNLTQPSGPLPRDLGAQACWTYFVMCEANIKAVGKGPETQIIYADNNWMDYNFENIRRGVMSLYGIDNFDDIARYFPAVEKAAELEGMPAPRLAYRTPKKGVIV